MGRFAVRRQTHDECQVEKLNQWFLTWWQGSPAVRTPARRNRCRIGGSNDVLAPALGGARHHHRRGARTGASVTWSPARSCNSSDSVQGSRSKLLRQPRNIDRTNCAATLTSVFGRDRASRSRLKKALVRIRIYDILVVIEDGSRTRKNRENLCTATTECYSED